MSVYIFGDVINLTSRLENSLNQGVRYPELHFSVYYVFWLFVKDFIEVKVLNKT